MKKKLLVFGLLVFMGALFADVADRPAARVELTDTVIIYLKQVERNIQLAEMQTGSALTADEKDIILDQMINEALVQQAAVRDGVTVSDAEALQTAIAQFYEQTGVILTEAQFVEYYSKQGVDVQAVIQTYKEKLVLQKYILQIKRDDFANMKEPAESEVEVFFNANATSFVTPEMIRFRHIYFDTKNLSADEKRDKYRDAVDVRTSLARSEASFEEMVALYSEDTTSKERGGDLGYLPRTDTTSVELFGSTFFNKLFKLKEGETSQVLESKVGYHIVQVTQHYPRNLLELDDPVSPLPAEAGETIPTVREQIVATLMEQKMQVLFLELSNEIVEELREEADVVIYDEYISW